MGLTDYDKNQTKVKNFDLTARLTSQSQKNWTLHEQKTRALGNKNREGEDYVSAPADYSALFEQYYSYVCGLVRKLGIDSQRTEDVASEILLRFMERDFLAKFDPEFVVEYAGVARPSRFKSFLSGFVSVYVQHHRDRQNVQAWREVLKCDQPVGDDGQATWIDVFGSCVVDDYSSIEEEELVAVIRDHLATVPRRSKHDVCDLPRLFDLIVVQARAEGRVDVKALQAEFGVSNTAIHSWLGLLRVQVRIAMEKPRVNITPAVPVCIGIRRQSSEF